MCVPPCLVVYVCSAMFSGVFGMCVPPCLVVYAFSAMFSGVCVFGHV